MRSVCEACAKPQPADWKAGDVCIHCGAASRREVRCFWCAKWTPAARFCRSCGAETVEPRLYGAARMIKEAGTDRFTVPKRLRELDPDQIENFTRIYQRHAAAAARHVDEVHFLQRFLFHQTFAAALEEELVPQLPWPDATLAAHSGPPLPAGDDRAAARAIEKSSPFSRTRSLAALARLRLDDWEASKAAYAAFDDPELRAEAALVLTGWRVRCSIRWLRDEDEFNQELRRSPFRLEAAVRLRDNPDLLREALASRNRETAFAAALALGDVDRLQAALRDGDDLERSVAGSKLIELGIIRPVVEPIRKSPAEVQRELVEALLARKEPAPEAADTLLEIVETTQDSQLRERAARVLCRQLRPEFALRIAKAARGERYIFQSLLSEGAALPPETVADVVDWMVDNGHFTMSQYGLSEAARRGAIRDDWVPRAYPKAGEKARPELLRLAEVQLGERGDEALHRFLMNVVFGPEPGKRRAEAWWVLHRTYRKDDVRGEGPFALEAAAIGRFFGSVREFLPKLSAVLRDDDALKEVGLYEFLAHLFKSARAEAVPALAAEEDAAHDLVRALLEAVRHDYWVYLIDAMIQFLGLIGSPPRWRDEAIAGLEALGKKGNYHWEKALRTLRLSVHGLPDEPGWPKLPSEYVPDRFAGATPAGRLALLRVAEQQLIHGKHPELLRFLLRTAFEPHEAETRIAALRIHLDRGGRSFRLSRSEAEHFAGPFRPFLDGIATALGDDALRADGPFREFLSRLLEHPGEAKDVVAEGEGADRLFRSLLACAEKETEHALRHWVIYFIGAFGRQSRWRDEAVAALKRLAHSGNNSAAGVLQDIPPPAPPSPPSLPPPPPETPHGGPTRHCGLEGCGNPPGDPDSPAPATPPPPPLNPWEEKQREAERLGRDLQEAALKISFGPGTPEEKTRAVLQLQAEFQARIKQLYGM